MISQNIAVQGQTGKIIRQNREMMNKLLEIEINITNNSVYNNLNKEQIINNINRLDTIVNKFDVAFNQNMNTNVSHINNLNNDSMDKFNILLNKLENIYNKLTINNDSTNNSIKYLCNNNKNSNEEDKKE